MVLGSGDILPVSGLEELSILNAESFLCAAGFLRIQ